MPIQFALRTDGGEDIGYGHLIRSSALAEEILDRGHAVTVASMTPDSARQVFPAAVETVNLREWGDPESSVEWLITVNPDAVFTDTNIVDTAYQRAIRERVPLAVMQDYAQQAVCADLYVNGNLYAQTLDYEFEGRQPEICLGPDYVLLRKEIRTLANEDPPWRDVPERALVTLGGSDTANLTPIITRAFDGFDISIDIVVGPGFSAHQERTVREAADAITADVTVTCDPPDLPERMFQADFALCTTSSTIYELFALGTPIIGVAVADNQEPIARALRDRNLATVLDLSSEEVTYRQAIETYLNDVGLRKQRRECGRALIDGRGTERVCSEFLSCVIE